ncbi:hypothetical protein [Namhaeicola litoreus]|uniref:DUF748 domain-containing protein n=1 Tax=Namhaeicola litoreus TaxID=1052145 RepID=A0ABW3Y461_9FLAO
MLKKLGLGFVILAVLSLVIIHYAKVSAEKRLKKALVENGSGLYVKEIEDISINLYEESLTFSGLSILPEGEAYNSLLKDSLGKGALVHVQLAQATVKYISIKELLLSRKIDINQIYIDHLNIKVFKNPDFKDSIKHNLPLDSIRLKKLNGISVSDIVIKNLNYQVLNAKNKDTLFQLDSLSFQFNGLALVKQENELFRLKATADKFLIENLAVSFPLKYYKLGCKVVELDFIGKSILIDSLNYAPTIKREELADTYKFNKEVNSIALKELDIYGVDFLQIIAYQDFYLDSVSLRSANFSIYKDKRKPFDKSVSKILPYITLKKLPVKFNLPKVIIENSSLVYQEKNPNHDLLLKVHFEEINGFIENITSVPRFKEDPMKVDASAKFMDQAELKVKMNFNLTDDNDDFSFAGTLGTSDFKYYDEILFPLFGLKIFSGKLDKLTFSAIANNNGSYGTMTMLYHDLEAKVFKKEIFEEEKTLSWLVNQIVHKSNPNKKGHIRSANLAYTREKYKGIGSLFWKTLQSGILHTLAPEALSIADKANERKHKKALKKQAKKKD